MLKKLAPRAESTLRIVCIALAAILLGKFLFVLLGPDPLKNVKVPAIPTWPVPTPVTTNAAAAKSVAQTNGPGATTNIAAASQTNLLATAKTNAPGSTQTNATALTPTNAIATSQTNAQPGLQTNAVASAQTNSIAAPQTNATAASKTNTLGAVQTNAVALVQTNAPSTNSAPTNTASLAALNASKNPKEQGRKSPDSPPAASVPNPTQARIDRIVQSEVFAPIMRPPPMMLMGIAGNDVFLRAPNGQTGMIKEGGELGGVKLLRIGINRVLLEEAGQKKELTIFSGVGSESLLPKE